jgi:hypothetical protein
VRERLVASAAHHVRTRHSLAGMARRHQELYLEVAPAASVADVAELDAALETAHFAAG